MCDFVVLEISVFSMASKEITRYVVDYISTQAWKNKTIIQSFHSTCLDPRSTIGHYRDLGISLSGFVLHCMAHLVALSDDHVTSLCQVYCLNPLTTL